MASLEVKKDSTTSFKYWYRHIKVKNPTSLDLPTIIYLPGGPGGSSITDFKLNRHLGLLVKQKLANVIQIDPRGVECNWLNPNNLTSEMVSTKKAYEDIIDIILKEKLKNYYIYGHSYGTILGTQLTHAIESRDDIPNPNKVIFEGIVGSTEKLLQNGYYGNIATLSNEVILEDPDLSYLIRNLDKYPRTYPLNFWAEQFSRATSLRIFSNKDFLLKTLSQQLKSENGVSEDLLGYLQSDYDFFLENLVSNSQDIENHFVRYSVWCTEINNKWVDHNIFAIKNYKLALKKALNYKDPCKDFKLKSSFDSKNFQIKSSVLYIQGELDVNTPLFSAKHHFNNQTKSENKNLLIISQDGHSPTRNKLKPCFTDFWIEILKPSSNFENVLNSSNHCK